RLAENELPLVVAPGLDEVPVELLGDAASAALELLAIRLGPPGSGAAVEVELGSAGIDAMGQVVRDARADPPVVLGIALVHTDGGRSEEACRQHHLVELKIDVRVGRGRR